MSLDISFDRHVDPFAKRFEECTKCGGRLALLVETKQDGGTRTIQVCRKCNNRLQTTEVNIVRMK